MTGNKHTHEVRKQDHGKSVVKFSGTRPECLKYMEEVSINHGYTVGFLLSNGGYRIINLEHEKKVKLQQAAPALLEACIEAKEMYERIQPNGGYQFVYDSLISAINKATQ
mgnify:FL=1